MFWYYSSNSKPFLTAIKKQTAEFLFHLWPKKNNCFYLSVIDENLEMGSNIKKADYSFLYKGILFESLKKNTFPF